jgi:hypothetical protein
MTRLERFLPKCHDKPRVDDRWMLRGVIFIRSYGLRRHKTPKETVPPKPL